MHTQDVVHLRPMPRPHHTYTVSVKDAAGFAATYTVTATDEVAAAREALMLHSASREIPASAWSVN